MHGVYSDILLLPVSISEVLADGGNARRLQASKAAGSLRRPCERQQDRRAWAGRRRWSREDLSLPLVLLLLSLRPVPLLPSGWR